MKSDILVIRSKSEEAVANDLSLELTLLGADVTVNAINSFAKLEDQLKEADENHSMVLLFVTEEMALSIDKAGIVIKKLPGSVATLGYGLKKEIQVLVEHRLPGLTFSTAKTLTSYSREVISELAKDSRSTRLAPRNSTKSLWRSPLYIFKAQRGLGPDDDEEILVDVTWSAKPTRPEMAPALVEALRSTFNHLNNKKLQILDFGAGKLRHTIPLLEKGHTVVAVDYQSLYQKPSPEIKKNLEKARSFKSQFAQLMYPADFAASSGHYDLIMLVNVLNVMPEPLERYFVIHKCNECLSKGGHLLWFCQYGDVDQIRTTSELRITDGGCTTKKGRKTFYKDYNSREPILRMMEVMGFEYVQMKMPKGKNHALLFQRVKDPALDVNLVIDTSRMVKGRRVFLGDIDSEMAVADVLDGGSFLGYGGALKVALGGITAGKKQAYEYEALIKAIIEYVFQEDFVHATIEGQYDIHRGRQRIDIKADYRQTSSLRTALVENMDLKSSWIPIECKNYTSALKNPEFAQMVMRCDQRHRRFGIILCRDVQNRKHVNETCHQIYGQHQYLVAVLDDADLGRLLEMADDGRFEDITNAVRRRVQEVLDLSD